jgi:hypothetical protein
MPDVDELVRRFPEELDKLKAAVEAKDKPAAARKPRAKR